MVDVINLALPYFGVIFIGFASGKARGLPETRATLDEFFSALRCPAGVAVRHHVADALCRTQQPALPDCNHTRDHDRFRVRHAGRRFIGGLSLREATLAGLCGGYGNIAATWVAVSRSRCSAPRRRCRRR
jgi:malonate transporter and related proteins